MAKTNLPILEQRRIEASVIKPIYRAMADRLGPEAAREILAEAITKDAIAQGAAYAEAEPGEPTLASFYALLDQWKAGGALEIELLRQSDTELHFNVTRCKYAEMYADMNLSEIGPTLSCARDGSCCTGYNPDIKLDRSQTIMQGAGFCDFRFRVGD